MRKPGARKAFRAPDADRLVMAEGGGVGRDKEIQLTQRGKEKMPRTSYRGVFRARVSSR